MISTLFTHGRARRLAKAVVAGQMERFGGDIDDVYTSRSPWFIFRSRCVFALAGSEAQRKGDK